MILIFNKKIMIRLTMNNIITPMIKKIYNILILMNVQMSIKNYLMNKKKNFQNKNNNQKYNKKM